MLASAHFGSYCEFVGSMMLRGVCCVLCVRCCVVVVVVVEIMKLYLVQTGRFLATTGYVVPSPNRVQNNVQKRS